MSLFSTACKPNNAPAGKQTNSGKYLYVNNDAKTSNSVSAFSINNDGTLTELSDSPYYTGSASNSDDGWYAANTIALAPEKGLLFVSNSVGNTITIFSINKNDGNLTKIGNPVSSGGTMNLGGSLAVDNSENYLFVANSDSKNISVFSVSESGSLTPVTGSPFAFGFYTSSIQGISLNSSGNILYAADPNAFPGYLHVQNIADDGSLNSIAGSPFSYYMSSFVLSSSTLGLAGSAGGNLSSYSIDSTGAPTLFNTLATGSGNSLAVSTARSGSLAILSGGDSGSISVVNVATNGTLTQVSGSPFATSANTSGYAIANPKGTFLYVTEWYQIEGFSIDNNGTLTSIGTFSLSHAGFPRGLVIY